MYTRATTVTVDPARVQDVVDFAQQRAKPVIEALPGSRGVSIFADRDKARVVVVSAWNSAREMQDSERPLRPLRDQAAELGTGRWQAGEYEVAVCEQPGAVPAGSWLRSTALSVDPTRLREVSAWFQRTLIRRLRGVDGFCAAMLMVDHRTGAAIGSTMWTSRDALQASAGAASGLRESVAAETGGGITGVAEYEAVIAGIQPTRHEHLFRRAYEAMSTGGDLDDLDPLTVEDIIEHSPMPPDLPTGRAGLKALMTAYREAIPDLAVTLERYIEQGDIGCGVLRMTGTHTGPLMGIPATGLRFDISGIDMVRVVDGRAVEHWGASDDLGMLVQLGAVTLPGAATVPRQQSAVDLTDKVDA